MDWMEAPGTYDTIILTKYPTKIDSLNKIIIDKC